MREPLKSLLLAVCLPCLAGLGCIDPNAPPPPPPRNNTWDCDYSCQVDGFVGTRQSASMQICVTPTGGRADAAAICQKKVNDTATPKPFCPASQNYNNFSYLGVSNERANRCNVLDDFSIRAGTFANMLPVPQSRRANITFAGETVAVSPSGQIAFVVEGGQIRLFYMHTVAADFEVKGKRVTEAEFINDGLPSAALQLATPPLPASARSFTFPARSFSVVANGKIDGAATGLDAPLTRDLAGTIDLPHRLVTLAGRFSNSDNSVVLETDLAYSIANLPPQADASATATTVECTGNLQAVISLDASRSSDPDGAGDIVSYAWLETTGGAATGLANTKTADVSLPLGSHEITLVVIDSAGQRDSTGISVNVVNTRPPSIAALSAVPGCLWPPNHQLVLFRLGTEIQVDASSTCDPSLELSIEGVHDNQPFLGGGQGNTTPDFLSGTAAACLRAERQGTSRAPRVYTLDIRVRDHQGNSTMGSVEVTAPHDQGHGSKCAKSPPGVVVSDDDPRCVATLLPATAPGPVSSGAAVERGGCSAAGAPEWLAAGALVLLRFARRRPARRVNKAEAT